MIYCLHFGTKRVKSDPCSFTYSFFLNEFYLSETWFNSLCIKLRGRRRMHSSERSFLISRERLRLFLENFDSFGSNVCKYQASAEAEITTFSIPRRAKGDHWLISLTSFILGIKLDSCLSLYSTLKFGLYHYPHWEVHSQSARAKACLEAKRSWGYLRFRVKQKYEEHMSM